MWHKDNGTFGNNIMFHKSSTWKYSVHLETRITNHELNTDIQSVMCNYPSHIKDLKVNEQTGVSELGL